MRGTGSLMLCVSSSFLGGLMSGGVQNMCRYGTSGCGLAGIVVVGWQFNLLILQVFSNPNDSMTL